MWWSNLRKKIENDPRNPRHLLTACGVGTSSSNKSSVRAASALDRDPTTWIKSRLDGFFE